MRTLLFAALLFTACPKPGPSPVGPTPSDAAASVSCNTACLHVFDIPGAASFDTCMGVCQPIQDPKFAVCLNSAVTVTDVNNCDRH